MRERTLVRFRLPYLGELILINWGDMTRFSRYPGELMAQASGFQSKRTRVPRLRARRADKHRLFAVAVVSLAHATHVLRHPTIGWHGLDRGGLDESAFGWIVQ